MTQNHETQCVIYDKTPKSQQKRVIIVVRPHYTVGKVMQLMGIFYTYANYDLILQPITGNLIHLNACASSLLFQIAGFEANKKNVLILLPPGEWDGNVNNRFDLTVTASSVASLLHPLSNNMISTENADTLSTTDCDADVSASSLSCDKENGATDKNSILPTNMQTSHPTTATMPLITGTNDKENLFEKNHYQNINYNSLSNDDDDNNNNNNNNDVINHNNNNNVINHNNVNKNTHMHTHTYKISTSIINNDNNNNNNNNNNYNNNNNPNKNNYSIDVNTVDILLMDALQYSPSTSDIEPNISDYENGDDDELALGASASPPETISSDSLHNETITGNDNVDNDENKEPAEKNTKRLHLNDKIVGNSRAMLKREELPQCSNSVGNKYVGLVNQAMTCYLNSLLQALFMTPEFRNTIYRWEFDYDNEKKNIPYQLQKLFLKLQTSVKSAVETTDLTRSFGWDSTEAWQQHDIQELCRVMFDALERKFMNTKQANLISNLYEGQMLDYVKCLECQTEKTRADKFLDIPLPVRPFGSNVGYGSIEEALRAFVQPETLDGNNQYFCEKCNKKCDAHKGLKFSDFPYILTLHLKRFDFDHQTLARIKLNDAVSFPETLNLNSFISEKDNKTNGLFNGGMHNPDDASTADSGSAIEDDNCSSGLTTTACSSQTDMNGLDDEGIELTTNESSSQLDAHESNGRYVYELFAIMIHSGSASGGHYYAYIKDFDSNKWFSFNDQNVAPITKEDIERSYGGTTNKSFYSGFHSSSNNAYMLMYRKIDIVRNETAMKVAEFPPHITKLLPHLAAEDEIRSTGVIQPVTPANLTLPELTNPRIYFYNPDYRKLNFTRAYVSRSADLNEMLASAHAMMDAQRFAPISRCRLVAFDSSCDEILQSFEDPTEPSVSDVIATCDGPLSFLLEYCAEGQKFDIYRPGGTTWYVFQVVLSNMQIDGPFLVYSQAQEANDILRESIANRMFLKSNEFLMATLPLKRVFIAYDPVPTPSAEQNLLNIARKHFRSLVHFYVNIPYVDFTDLECLGISTEEVNSSYDVVDAVMMNGVKSEGLALMSTSPLSTGQESNSEDSSLSDGDRTLVEKSPLNKMDRKSAQYDCEDNSDSKTSSSSSPVTSSPDDEELELNRKRLYALYRMKTPRKQSPIKNAYDAMQHNVELNASANQTSEVDSDKKSLFFKAIRIPQLDTFYTSLAELLGRQNGSSGRGTSSDAVDGQSKAPTRAPGFGLKIIANSRMSMDEFKRHLEHFVGVPSDYFELKRAHETSDPLNLGTSLLMMHENEVITLELGKSVTDYNEHKTKISYMRLKDLSNESGALQTICDWFYMNDVNVAKAKKELVAKFHRLDPKKYSTLTVETCRLWLKSGKNPLKILADNIILANEVCASTIASEFLIQEVEPGQSTQPPPENGLVIFIRKWHPDTMILDGFEEITLTRETEIREAISQLSDIPKEHIAYIKLSSSFPCTNISILTYNANLTWLTNPATLDKYPLNTTIDGNVYLYKDTRVTPLELNNTERRKWAALEKARLDRLGYSSTALISQRRERGLKIYLDSPPTATTAAAKNILNGSETPTSSTRAAD